MSHAARRSSGLERRRTACAGVLLCTCLTWTSGWADDQLARGKRLYEERCGACHSLDEHGAGPKHRGLLGRKAATQAGFEYSAALAAAEMVWLPTTLERWIANPNTLIPGNRMIVRLANDPDERAAIVAYLVDTSERKRGANSNDGLMHPTRRSKLK